MLGNLPGKEKSLSIHTRYFFFYSRLLSIFLTPIKFFYSNEWWRLADIYTVCLVYNLSLSWLNTDIVFFAGDLTANKIACFFFSWYVYNIFLLPNYWIVYLSIAIANKKLKTNVFLSQVYNVYPLMYSTDILDRIYRKLKQMYFYHKYLMYIP